MNGKSPKFILKQIEFPVLILRMHQWRTVIGNLGYRTPTTFFLQMFVIVIYCKKKYCLKGKTLL